MKKIICLVLFLVMAVFTLSSCAEEVIGEYLENYDYVPPVVEDLSLNFYIVCGEGTTQNSKDTIKRTLSQYAYNKFHTSLELFFLDEASYTSAVIAATAPGAENRADIVLINSKSLMDSLVNAGALADLTDLFSTKEFGTLNVTIASDILAASAVTIGDQSRYFCVPNNHIVGDYNNNGILGDKGYDYIVIDEQVARYYHFGDDVLATYTSRDALMADYAYIAIDQAVATEYGYTEEMLSQYKSVEDVMADGAIGSVLLAAKDSADAAVYAVDANGNVASVADPTKIVVQFAEGNLAKKAELEASGKYCFITRLPALGAVLASATDGSSNPLYTVLENGNIVSASDNTKVAVEFVNNGYDAKAAYEAAGKYCTVAKYPTTTAEDAFLSAFGVVNGTKNVSRAMEIIYAINNDAEFRNILQYGIEGTNYDVIDGNVVPVKATDEKRSNSVYNMNILYTGDLFLAKYCAEYGWTPAVADSGAKQNRASENN